MHIYGGGNIYLDKDMEKPGSSAHVPKRTVCTPWFFRMSAGAKLNCALTKSGLNSKKKCKFCICEGSIYTRGISEILTINAPKRQRTAGSGNSPVIHRFRVQSRVERQLWETLIDVQSFHSVCLKIGVKVKRSTL